MHGESHRRRAGLALLLAVLLLAVAVPQLVGRSIAGSPLSAAVPGPPAIGECVAAPVDGWNTGPPVRGELTYPAVAVLPCGRLRSGEVIAVIPADQVVRPAPSSSAAETEPDRNAQWCEGQLNGYLGLPAADSPDAQTRWQPLATLRTAVAGPTSLQRAFGQHWLSCIGYVAAGLDGTAAAYDRTLRQGYTSGRLPRAAAQCLLSDDPQRQIQVPCSAPHQAELLGSGWTATSVAALTPTCRQLARQLTGMVDPTAGGALAVETAQQRVQIITIEPAGEPDADPDAAGSPAVGRSTGEALIPVCMVAAAAHHALAGPLVDLGTGPVPWR